jgi:hypothetical protein
LTRAYRQHRGRICSVAQMWASGHLTDERLVSVVRNGKPEPIASCSIGYAATDEPCPDPFQIADLKPVAHWNSAPNLDSSFSAIPGTEDLWKYDPDLEPAQYDQPWMNDCLFAPAFPPPALHRPN